MEMKYPKTPLRTQSAFGKVAVVYGGQSAEREVSLRSGRAVLNALQEQNIDVVGLDLQENPISQILSAEVDRVFIAMHGPGGEDGRIQAALDLMGLPYTGSGHVASAVAMDKLLTKQMWAYEGLPTPAFCRLDSDSDWAEVFAKLGNEVVVKPVHEGSSLGMAFANNVDDLKHAYEQAHDYDRDVMAEATIFGQEYTVAILNGVALPSIRIEARNMFYDYDAKYHASTTEYFCPSGLSDEDEIAVRKLSLAAFDAIDCDGWGRVDLMRNIKGDFYLLEVNTVPGMTDRSLVPMAAKQAGLTFGELVLEILQYSRL